jgi:Tfp pilus assembly protein PilF
LEIKPDDEEALCNLALALKRTSYLDYAKMAFEEAVNVSPGNTFILTNYMMFLLEQKSFNQFDRVMPHARRVMDSQELAVLSGLEAEFKDAVGGSGAIESDASY